MSEYVPILVAISSQLDEDLLLQTYNNFKAKISENYQIISKEVLYLKKSDLTDDCENDLISNIKIVSHTPFMLPSAFACFNPL